MHKKINQNIIDFIDESEYDENMKDFLKKILNLEYDLIEEMKKQNKDTYWYTTKYKNILNELDL